MSKVLITGGSGKLETQLVRVFHRAMTHLLRSLLTVKTLVASRSGKLGRKLL